VDIRETSSFTDGEMSVPESPVDRSMAAFFRSKELLKSSVALAIVSWLMF